MSNPLDPLYSSQWHFDLLGDIETIWDEFDGSGVTVAVYDDGLQYTHPDLNDNYDSSQHFSFGGTIYDPTPIDLFNDGHGTSVAGIIAAENNGIGGVGVAWGATLTGVNLLEDIQYGRDGNPATWSFVDRAFYQAALQHAANFDIMSNSWGVTPLYSSRQSLDAYVSFGDAASFEFLVDNGRDGLGTIITQAAGNDTMNLNGDGLNAMRQTISVAATGTNGTIEWYSNWGAGLLIAAPAASVTTDLTGNFGDAFGDYMTDFGGTSAATPVVSGVVALMLDAESGLGWRCSEHSCGDRGPNWHSRRRGQFQHRSRRMDHL